MLDALAPVALLVGLGYLLRASSFMPEASWAPIDRLVYYLLFPCLLFGEIARAELGDVPVVRVGACLLAVQLAMTALAMGLRPLLRLDGPAFTSVVQCVVRWNSYVGLALAPALVGPEGVPLAAVAVAVMVPSSNLISVAALARHGSAAQPGALAFVRAAATNPLIVATLLGALVNLIGLRLPTLVLEPVSIAGRAALALGLLTVGAGLRPRIMVTRPLVVLTVTAAQLLVKPVLAVAAALLLGLTGPPLVVVALACAVPTATSSYILARLLGGDALLMAALITTTTVAALATLPLVLGAVRGLG